MKKFDGILFCTDIDGTLYNDDKTISDDNLQAIEYFKSEGGLFTFITGRHHIVSGEIYNAIKPNAPIGCLNGGGVYDYKKGEFLWCKTLPQRQWSLCVKFMKSFRQLVISLMWKIIYISAETTRQWNIFGVLCRFHLLTVITAM